MFRCFGCDLTFSNNVTLVLHVQLSHTISKTFRCMESDCDKIYKNFTSYKRHRNIKHCIHQPCSNENNKIEFFGNSNPSVEVPKSIAEANFPIRNPHNGRGIAPVLADTGAVLAASAGAVLAYIWGDNNVLHWTPSAGPLLVVGTGVVLSASAGTVLVDSAGAAHGASAGAIQRARYCARTG